MAGAGFKTGLPTVKDAFAFAFSGVLGATVEPVGWITGRNVFGIATVFRTTTALLWGFQQLLQRELLLVRRVSQLVWPLAQQTLRFRDFRNRLRRILNLRCLRFWDFGGFPNTGDFGLDEDVFDSSTRGNDRTLEDSITT